VTPVNLTARLGFRRDNDHSGKHMTGENSAIFRTKEYRGCGIQAASYEAGPRNWIPEACFWIRAQNGWRRLWVNSFAHCLATHNLSFPSQIEADAWAFRLACTLIDKTLPELNPSMSTGTGARMTYLSRILELARRPLAACRVLKENKYRN
jgi:hypothetical protein